jgi:acetyltransferase-like isoleucine patch superfamily enzyme
MSSHDIRNEPSPTQRLFATLLKKLRGQEYNLDPAIPVSALLSLGLRRMTALVRGTIRLLVFRNTSGRVFIAADVELRNIKSIQFGRWVTLDRNVFIDGLSRDGVRIGDGVTIGRASILRCTGVLSNIGEGIEIGANSGLDAFCFVGGAGGVKIGRNVIMGQHVSFHAESHNFNDTELAIRHQGTTRIGIVIEDDCWIGANVTFLDGTHVGRGCVIGAGAVVRGTIPDYSIAVGIPARVVRSRKDAIRE